MKRLIALAALIPLVTVPALHAIQVKRDGREIRLATVIVVNQLKAGVLEKLSPRFGEGGFKLFLQSGLVFSNARFSNANTLTLVNDAILSTGADPARHGIVDNSWFDRGTGKEVNCIRDPAVRRLDGSASALPGASPRHLAVPTVGDELVRLSGGASRCFAVAAKDKGAIFLGGGKGKAFWYGDRQGRMTTSTWYFPAMPEWAAKWNAGDPARRYRGRPWTLSAPEKSYGLALPGYAKQINPGYALGRRFPHLPDTSTDSTFYGGLTFTPFIDELVLDFTRALIEGENAGGQGHTDLLWISLSAADLIGHVYGPSSLEYEDNLLRLDRALAGFMAGLEKRNGPGGTLFVLTSDHGNHDIPALLQAQGKEAGRINPKEMTKALNDGLKAHFKSSEDLLFPYRGAGFVFKPDVVKRLGLTLFELEQELAKRAQEIPGVARAFTRTDILSGRAGEDSIARAVVRAFHPERSGDVFIVQKQGWFLLAADNPNFSSMHGSPYSPDTHVPLVFMSPGLRPDRIDRPVAMNDLAASLCGVFGIKPPVDCSGTPLPEMADRK